MVQLMDSLIEFVENYKKSNPSGWRKWIFGSIAVIIVLVIVFVYSIREALRQREIARLRHERDLLEEQARQQPVNTQLAGLAEEQGDHTTAAQEATQRAAELSRKAELLEVEHQRNLDLINSIKSWDEVDARIN